jgi:hypothetical protein
LFAHFSFTIRRTVFFLLYEDGSSEDVTPTLLVGLKPLLDACNERNRQSDAWYPHQALSEPFPGTPFPTAKFEDLQHCISADQLAELRNAYGSLARLDL